MRHETLPLQRGDDGPVAADDHLVKKEVEPVWGHLPTHGIVTCEPHVVLLGDRGIEEPRVLGATQLRVSSRVAVVPAVLMRRLVLALEVEHIDSEANPVKVVVTPALEMLQHHTGTVVDNMIRGDHVRKLVLEQGLNNRRNVRYVSLESCVRRTETLAGPSPPYRVSRPTMTPQDLCMTCSL